jgi:hypothetical protein
MAAYINSRPRGDLPELDSYFVFKNLSSKFTGSLEALILLPMPFLDGIRPPSLIRFFRLDLVVDVPSVDGLRQISDTA